jgi:hypothetical protein
LIRKTIPIEREMSGEEPFLFGVIEREMSDEEPFLFCVIEREMSDEIWCWNIFYFNICLLLWYFIATHSSNIVRQYQKADLASSMQD